MEFLNLLKPLIQECRKEEVRKDYYTYKNEAEKYAGCSPTIIMKNLT